MGMNYETHFASEIDMAHFDPEALRARKRRRVILALVVAAMAIIAAALLFGRKGNTAEAGAPTVAPVVTVLSPGQSAVQGTVTATGSLNARIDMPVGAVGE